MHYTFKAILTLAILLNLLFIAVVIWWPINYVLVSFLTSVPSNLDFPSFESIFISVLLALNTYFLLEVEKKYKDRDLIIKDLKEIINTIEILESRLRDKEHLEKMGEKVDEHSIKSRLVLHDIGVYKQLLKKYENEKI
jgi:hypothetical protein